MEIYTPKQVQLLMYKYQDNNSLLGFIGMCYELKIQELAELIELESRHLGQGEKALMKKVYSVRTHLLKVDVKCF